MVASVCERVTIRAGLQNNNSPSWRMLMAVFAVNLELLSPLIYFACATLSVFLLNCLKSFLASLNLISSINFLSFPREARARRLIEVETIVEIIVQLCRQEIMN